MGKSKRKQRKYKKSKLKKPKLRIPIAGPTKVTNSGKLYNRRKLKKLLRKLEE